MTPAVRTLLFATVGIFFVQMTMPAFVDPLVFVPQDALLRPWTIVTYMFVHAGFTHILFNMLGLYFFGPRVEERLGTGRFTALYFLSGASGALLSLGLAIAGIGTAAPIIGASAGVFGVMLGFAHYWPHEPVYLWGVLAIPARILVLLTTAFSLWAGFSGAGGNVAHFAHLGGYAGAFLYLLWVDGASRRFRRAATPAPPITRRTSGNYVVDRSAIHEVNRPEVDRILDKISAHGIASLTDAERAFLSNFVPMDDRKPPVS